MPKQVKLRRGTTAQHAEFIGALGEISVDTSKKTLVCHDGATAGGFPVALETVVSVRIGNMLWVDAVNGNDSTGTRGKAYLPFLTRSEERRVGKECRARWSPNREKKRTWEGERR